ncbi:arginine transporter permease subunit ArtQ [Kluyvera cryocrescens]|uniref:Arginine transporter permease subunit ArtQ n=1 Tax=Kluyvera cryocrescens TaxID=580 RepID=A0A485CU79_KLUCR|nr:arginine transporter permease subunit ArtQ [Kluyvera cryocrescens]
MRKSTAAGCSPSRVDKAKPREHWGLRYAGIQWRVIIPQALRVALPALANEYIAIVKLSSLVSVISLTEILMVGQRLYSQKLPRDGDHGGGGVLLHPDRDGV